MSRQLRYFVNHATRMVRTIDAGDREPPPPWTEVIAQGYDQFVKITKIFLTLSNGREARKVGNGRALLLRGIKRLASRTVKATSCTKAEALDSMSQAAGFNNYIDAVDQLGEGNE